MNSPAYSSSSSSLSTRSGEKGGSSSFSFGVTKMERKGEENLELDLEEGGKGTERKEEGKEEGKGKKTPNDHQVVDMMLKEDWMKAFPHSFSSIEVFIHFIFHYHHSSYYFWI